MGNCSCVKCNHEWNSYVASPQRCPVCKRRDWNAAGGVNSSGRPVAGRLVEAARHICKRCAHNWASSKAGGPDSCPACKSYNWRVPGGGGINRRGPRTPTVTCQSCANVFVDNGKGLAEGMCPMCGVSRWTGKKISYTPPKFDGTTMAGDRWSFEGAPCAYCGGTKYRRIDLRCVLCAINAGEGAPE